MPYRAHTPDPESDAMELDRNGLEVLASDQCLRLLAQAPLGRVGLTSGALPVILPVNFLLQEDHILVRTGRGTKLDAATRNAVVAFEADPLKRLVRLRAGLLWPHTGNQ